MSNTVLVEVRQYEYDALLAGMEALKRVISWEDYTHWLEPIPEIRGAMSQPPIPASAPARRKT